MPTITLTAPLDADAENRCTRDGQHLLMVRVALPAAAGVRGRQIVVRATKRYGAGPAAGIACRTRSRQLRRGVLVTLTADAMTWVRGVAELHGVHDVHAPNLAVPMHGATDH